MRARGRTQKEIADTIGRDKSVVSCELRRNGGTLYRHCRHRLKRRVRPVGAASRIRNRKGIELRPAEADGTRLGDLEMDLMVGRNNQDAVLTMVDRLTGYTWIRVLPDGKDAKGVANACMDIIAPIRRHVRALTTDNGPNSPRTR